MSAQVIARFLGQNGYTDTTRAEFRILIALADAANADHGNELWMRNTALATKARTSPSTVKRSLQSLRRKGLLRLEVDNSRNGLDDPNKYTLHPDRLPVAERDLVPTDDDLAAEAAAAAKARDLAAQRGVYDTREAAS